MGSLDRPLTQFDMFALTRAVAPNKVEEQAGSPSALRNDVLKKRARSPATLLDITPSKIARAAGIGPLRLQTTCKSPWDDYEKIYSVELGGSADVAVRKASPVELVNVRVFSTRAAEETLHVYRQLDHRNIVTALEAFTIDSGLYMVLEHMPLSLEQIVRSPAYPDERQLAAILGQVVTGVAYLAEEGFEHKSLTCQNILLNADGDVKIANQESCHLKSESKGETPDIMAISSITMELMQKYVKEDGAIGVDDLHRWPSNSDAVEFLSATSSAASASELLNVSYTPSPTLAFAGPILTVVAPTAEPYIPEGVTHRHYISGPGLYTWALQVYTKRSFLNYNQ